MNFLCVCVKKKISACCVEGYEDNCAPSMQRGAVVSLMSLRVRGCFLFLPDIPVINPLNRVLKCDFKLMIHALTFNSEPLTPAVVSVQIK